MGGLPFFNASFVSGWDLRNASNSDRMMSFLVLYIDTKGSPSVSASIRKNFRLLNP